MSSHTSLSRTKVHVEEFGKMVPKASPGSGAGVIGKPLDHNLDAQVNNIEVRFY